MVAFEEARDLDLWHEHEEDDIRAIALGTLAPVRVRSPDEREAELCAENKDKWAERRQLTSPGPFSDLAILERKLDWISQFAAENAVRVNRDIAEGMQGYGRPNEMSERDPYFFSASSPSGAARGRPTSGRLRSRIVSHPHPTPSSWRRRWRQRKSKSTRSSRATRAAVDLGQWPGGRQGVPQCGPASESGPEVTGEGVATVTMSYEIRWAA
jgi:hypothetical protein